MKRTSFLFTVLGWEDIIEVQDEVRERKGGYWSESLRIISNANMI